MSDIALSGRIPPEIRVKLRGMLWRARLVVVVRGLAVLLGTLLTALLLAVAVDQHLLGHVERYVILYEWPMRLAVTGAIVVACAVVAGVVLLRPLMRAYSVTGIARTIEEANPELEERLSSTVELLASRDPEALRGSEQMIAALSSQAVSRARGLSLRGVIRWDRTARYWAVTLLIALLAAVLATRWPDAFAASLKRLVLANFERVGSVELVIVGHADRIVPAGEPVMIQTEVRGGFTEHVWLLLRSEDDRLQTIEMAAARGEQAVFTHTLPRVEGSWRYQVRTLDSHTPWHELRAVPRPMVVGLSAVVTPPAYSNRKQRELGTLPPMLKVLRHGQISLLVRTNKPVHRAVLEFEGGQTRDLSGGGENGPLTASLTSLSDTSFRVLLVDEHGLDNLSPARFRLKVVRDRPPAVSIVSPGRRVTLKPEDALPIRFRARDDLGLSRAELEVVVGEGEPRTLPIELPKDGTRRFESQAVLDLSAMQLEGVRRVGYRVSVADTLPQELGNGPQTAVSAEHEIEIDQAAQSFKMQLLKNVRKEFEGALAKIDQTLEAADTEVASLHDAATKEQPWTDKDAETSTAVRGQLREAEELTQRVAEISDYTDYRKLGERLALEIGQRHIAPAERLLVQAELGADDLATRTDRLGRAKYEIDRARTHLAELAKQFDDAAAYQETAQALAEAAKRQASLAEQMRAMSTDQLPEGVLQPTSMPMGQAQALQPTGEPPPNANRATPGPAGQPGNVSPQSMSKLTEEQRELMESIQQMVAANPDLMRPVLDVQQSQNKTLLEQLTELAERERQLLGYAEEQKARDALQGHREKLAKSQEAIAAKAEALAKDHAKTLEAAKARLPDRASLAEPAEAIRLEKATDAAKAQARQAKALKQAADRVEAHAKALAKQQRQSAGQSQDVARQIKRLSQEQAALRKSSQQLARRLKPLGVHLRDKLMADLAAQQKELAKEAAKLSDELATPSGRDGMVLPAEPNPRAQKASMQAKRAAEAMERRAKESRSTPSSSASDEARAAMLEHQRAAAEALTHLAEDLQRSRETDPTRWEARAVEDYLRVQNAERALELAERQQRLSRELNETLANRPVRAVGMEQEQLADEVAQFALAADFMAEQLEMMGGRIQGAKPKVLESVKRASDLLRKSAPETMRRAAAELKADRAAQAVRPMKTAAKSVQEAQKILSSLQGQLASAAKKAKPGPADSQALDGQLVEALQDQYDTLRRMLEAEQAAGDASTDQAQALARAMEKKLAGRAAQASASATAARMQASAKDFLQAAWELAGAGQANPDEAVIMPTPAMGEGNWRVYEPDSTILELETLGLSRSDWARLPGTLREDVIQAAEDKAPPGYRDLIRSYFRALGRQAALRDAQPLVGQEADSKQPGGEKDE